LFAEGFGEVAGVGEACGVGYCVDGGAGQAEEELCAVDSALEEVLVRSDAHAVAEGAGEVIDAEAGDLCELIETDFVGEVGGDEVEDAPELGAGDASDGGDGSDWVTAIFADEGDGERQAEKVAVERAGGPVGGDFALHLGEEETELLVVEGPEDVEVAELFHLKLIGGFEEDGWVDGGDDSLGCAVPEEAVACAGREEDKVSGGRVDASGASAGVPVHLDGAGSLEMETEGGVFVLGDLYSAYAVLFQDDSLPRRALIAGEGLTGEKRDGTVSA
jgi:hypothetical protein